VLIGDLVFRVLFVVIFALFASVRIYYRFKVSRARPEDTEQHDQKKPPRTWAHVVLSVSILVLFIASFLYLLLPTGVVCCSIPFPSFVRWMGVILGFLSLPFLIWILVKLCFTARRTEVVSFALILRSPFCSFFVNFHFTNWVNCHEIHHANILDVRGDVIALY